MLFPFFARFLASIIRVPPGNLAAPLPPLPPLALDRFRYRYSVRFGSQMARRCPLSVQNTGCPWPRAAVAAASVLQKSSMVCPVRFPCTIA
jgi:hypothetical protein